MARRPPHRCPLGATVVVHGAGPIGLLTAQHARWAGAGRILIVEPVARRREAAQALGFVDVVEPDADLGDLVRDGTDGRGADVVFECTGVAPLLQPTAELVRRGGTLSLAGYTTEPSQVSYGDWVARELRVVASLAHVHDDFLGAMRALEIGAVEVGPLVTAVVGLAGLGECSRSWAPGARRSQGARRPVGGRHRHGLTPAARRSPGAGRGPGRLTR